MLHKTATILLGTQEVPKFEESSLRYIIEELQRLSYKILKTSIISYKNSSVLATEIETSIKQSDIVILIGGISNPHYSEVLAKIFHQKLIFNERLARLLHVQNGALEIAEPNCPEHAKVLEHEQVFPAVYLQGLILTVCDLKLLQVTFTKVLKPFLINFNKELKLKRCLTIEKMNYIEEGIRVKDNVDVSWEQIENNRLKVTLSSPSLSCLLEYEEHFKENCGGNVLECREGTDIAKLVYAQDCYAYMRSSIECIEECFAKYGPENVFICFNGGKDCTVLLHLTLGVLRKNYPHTNKTFCVYIENPNPFSEVNKFITQCELYYDLDILRISKNIKESLALVLEEKPNMKACLMGTRRTDPFSENLNSFQMTDPDWPQVMRVCPLLDWHYSEIWDYLLNTKVPYCSLYDNGYTSLGSRLNSVSNPALLIKDPLKGSEIYLPAYKLLDASCERNGRKSSQKYSLN